MAIAVTGAEEIRLIAAACRQLGADKTIVREMKKELNKAVPPLRKLIRAHAMAILPRRGGLNVWVAKASITGIVRTSAESAGVYLRGRKKGHDLKAIDAGSLRHPVFADARLRRREWTWVAQTVPSGFFTDAVTQEARYQLERAAVAAADRAAEKILSA